MFKADEICEECKGELIWTTFAGKLVCYDCYEDLVDEAERQKREE